MQLQQYGGQHTIHSRKSRGPLYSCALEEQLDLNIESLAVTLTASQPQIRLETSLFDDLIQEKDEKKAILTASLNEFDFKAIGHAIRQKLLQYYTIGGSVVVVLWQVVMEKNLTHMVSSKLIFTCIYPQSDQKKMILLTVGPRLSCL